MALFNSDLPSAQNELRLNYSPELLSYVAPSWWAVALISFDKSLKGPGTNVSIHLHSDYSAGERHNPHTHSTRSRVHSQRYEQTLLKRELQCNTANTLLMRAIVYCDKLRCVSSMSLNYTIYACSLNVHFTNSLTWTMLFDSQGSISMTFSPFLSHTLSWLF